MAQPESAAPFQRQTKPSGDIARASSPAQDAPAKKKAASDPALRSASRMPLFPGDSREPLRFFSRF